MPVVIPHTLAEACAALKGNPQSTLLSGGTDLMVEVNFNHRRPTDVIVLRHIAELSEWSINHESSAVHIGAGVPYAEMEIGALAVAVPALAAAARTVGSPQIRSAGTIGGNLGTCSPAGDTLPVLSALDAQIHLVSAGSQRTISFSEFMTGPKKNQRLPEEIVSGITVPISNGWQGYSKVGVRNAMVISVASACLAVQDGSVRLALGSVGPIILRCPEAEAFISTHLKNSSEVSPEIAREFGRIAASESRPIDDHRSTAAYRRHAISVLATRLLQRGLPS
jgi:CO/xanthine dehydrogenase FAD-binding subunit